MTNADLLKVAYAETHHSADYASQCWAYDAQLDPISPDNFCVWKNHLLAAICAVTELERLARGGNKPKEG